MKQTKNKTTNLYIIFFYILKQYCQNIQIFQDYDNFFKSQHIKKFWRLVLKVIWIWLKIKCDRILNE